MSDQEQTLDVTAIPAEGTEEYKALTRSLIAEFRANGGRLNDPLADLPVLVLTTTGARTGQPRTNLVAYVVDNGRPVFVAAKAEDVARHPDWFYNLRANPNVTVELGTETYPARAAIMDGAERQRLFDRIAADLPPEFAGYLDKTYVEIPVIALDRVG